MPIDNPAWPPRHARAIGDPEGKRRGPQVDDEYLFKVVDALDGGKETGKTMPQIALNLLLQRPTVSTVVVGARNELQLKQSLGAVAPHSPTSRRRPPPLSRWFVDPRRQL
jgi:aryl-alcohol dehydrogenase-like predicted oxidoreductase